MNKSRKTFVSLFAVAIVLLALRSIFSHEPRAAAQSEGGAVGACVQRSWAEANTYTLVGCLKAGIEGIRWAYDPGDRSDAAASGDKHLKIGRAIAVRSVDAAVGSRSGLAEDARFDRVAFENMLRIRDKIAGTWGGRIPPAEKYLDLSYYDRALAEL